MAARTIEDLLMKYRKRAAQTFHEEFGGPNQQEDTREMLAAITALKDLLGFAERNEKRAKQAHADACAAYITNCSDGNEIAADIMQARRHEAERFAQVVRMRVAEALR